MQNIHIMNINIYHVSSNYVLQDLTESGDVTKQIQDDNTNDNTIVPNNVPRSIEGTNIYKLYAYNFIIYLNQNLYIQDIY